MTAEADSTTRRSADPDLVRAALGRLKVALVHDWVTGMRGGERVLEALSELAPHGDLFTLIHLPGSTSPLIEKRRVTTSWINRLPSVGRYYRWLLPLFPAWIDRLDLSAYDVVLSSSHCIAKGARARPGGLHLCYCHTPMRYIWDRFDDYFGHRAAPLRWLIGLQARRLRAWDRRTSGRVDGWMANSSFVRSRIVDLYGVAPERVEVVPPPVDVERFAAAAGSVERSDRYLVVSALVPYKRVEVAVEACGRSGRGLDVVGHGPELGRLRELAARVGDDRIRFHGFLPDRELPRVMASGRALLLPGVEDFGIAPVEAMAAGLPVVAQGRGGVLDTVESGRTGLLYEGAGVEGLIEALDRFEGQPGGWDRALLEARARQFAPQRFAAAVAGQLAAHGIGS